MITLDLTGKNALVTGGTRGIGRAISHRLAEAGASTAAVFHTNEDTATLSLQERQAFGAGEHHNYQYDTGNAAQITALAEHVTEDFGGKLDILVLNAAAMGSAIIGEIDTAQWQRMLDVNLTGPMLLSQAFLPIMGRGGSIVSIASGAGHEAMAGGFAPYGASKAGLILFTQDMAQDLGPRGIRANVVSPGSTNSSFGIAPHSEANPSKAAGHNALRRQGVPDDIARVVLFLASDLSAFVTGQAIRVNGGAV